MQRYWRRIVTLEATIWVGSLLGAHDPMVSIMRERDKRKHRGPPSQRVGPHLSYMPIPPRAHILTTSPSVGQTNGHVDR